MGNSVFLGSFFCSARLRRSSGRSAGLGCEADLGHHGVCDGKKPQKVCDCDAFHADGVSASVSAVHFCLHLLLGMGKETEMLQFPVYAVMLHADHIGIKVQGNIRKGRKVFIAQNELIGDFSALSLQGARHSVRS